MLAAGKTRRRWRCSIPDEKVGGSFWFPFTALPVWWLVLAQSDLRFGRRCGLKNFKMAAIYLGYWNRTSLAILNFLNTTMPPIKFKLSQTYCSEADVI